MTHFQVVRCTLPDSPCDSFVIQDRGRCIVFVDKKLGAEAFTAALRYHLSNLYLNHLTDERLRDYPMNAEVFEQEAQDCVDFLPDEVFSWLMRYQDGKTLVLD